MHIPTACNVEVSDDDCMFTSSSGRVYDITPLKRCAPYSEFLIVTLSHGHETDGKQKTHAEPRDVIVCPTVVLLVSGIISVISSWIMR